MNLADGFPSSVPMTALTFDDEDLASRSRATLLITAIGVGESEACARRVHGLSARGRLPFVHADAGQFPTGLRELRSTCSDLLDAAAGGTLYVNAIEAMPPLVQEGFIDLLNELGSARDATAGVRLVAGTSVSLFECIAAGSFAQSLFYRLNIIHLTLPNESRERLAMLPRGTGPGWR
jgi:DNA-binding NtrC family response regulator